MRREILKNLATFHNISNGNETKRWESLQEMWVTIHPIKTEAMIIRKTSFVGPIPPLYFNTGHIDLVNYTTCLGVKIDNKLTWTVHIDSIKKHFTQKVGALKRMRILPKKVLEEIYFKSHSQCNVWNLGMGKLFSFCTELSTTYSCKSSSYCE